MNLNSYLEAIPHGYKEEELPCQRTHYVLGPRPVQLAVPGGDLRGILRRAVYEADLQSHEYPVFRPCVVSNLRDCFKPENPFRARVCFDLDSTGEAASLEIGYLVDILYGWLSDFTDAEDVQEEKLVILGARFEDKPISMHVYFPGLCWERKETNAYRENAAAFEALNAKIAAFGLVADMSITNAGLKYPYMDKWKPKDKAWRGDSLGIWWGDIHPDTFFDEMDPLVLPHDICSEISWAPHARTKRARHNAQPEVQNTTVQCMADDLAERLGTVVPQWANVQWKTIHKPNGKVVHLPESTFCPFKELPTDLPAHEHSVRKCYAVSDATGQLVVRCFVCVNKELTIEGPVLDDNEAVAAVLASYNARFACLPGDDVLILPAKTSHGVKPAYTLKQNQLIAQETRLGEVFKVDKKNIPWPKFWLQHPRARRYPMGVIFDPSQRAGNDYYNTYGGFERATNKVALTLGQPDPARFACWMEMVQRNICDGSEEHLDYLLDWMAHVVQRPEKKTGVMIVLTGEAGAGKGLTGRMFFELWGDPHGLQIDAAAIGSDFNAFLARAVAVFVDESSRPKNEILQNKWKNLITESAMLEHGKYKDQKQVHNYCNFIMASNSTGVHWQEHERRFAIFDCAKRIAKEDNVEFFNSVAREVESAEVRGHFLRFLQERDISRFVVQRYPLSHATFDAQLESMDLITRYIFQICKTGDLIDEHGDWPPTAEEPHWRALCDEIQEIQPNGTSYNIDDLGHDVFNEPHHFHPFQLMVIGMQKMAGGRSMQNMSAELAKRCNKIFGGLFGKERRAYLGKRVNVVHFGMSIEQARTKFMASRGCMDQRIWNL